MLECYICLKFCLNLHRSFRDMSQKPVSKRSASGRLIKSVEFETDPETLVERSSQQENLNTRFLFYCTDALFSCQMNSDNWPIGTTTDDKLSLQPGTWIDAFFKRKPTRCLYIGKGTAKVVSDHKDETYKRLKRGLPPLYLKEPKKVQTHAPRANAEPSRASEYVSNVQPAVSNANRVLFPDDEPNDPIQPGSSQTVIDPTTPTIASDNICGAVCEQFNKFIQEHEQRMVRAKSVGVILKQKSDKKRKRNVAELNELVNLLVCYFCCKMFFSD